MYLLEDHSCYNKEFLKIFLSLDFFEKKITHQSYFVLKPFIHGDFETKEGALQIESCQIPRPFNAVLHAFCRVDQTRLLLPCL